MEAIENSAKLPHIRCLFMSDASPDSSADDDDDVRSGKSFLFLSERPTFPFILNPRTEQYFMIHSLCGKLLEDRLSDRLTTDDDVDGDDAFITSHPLHARR